MLSLWWSLAFAAECDPADALARAEQAVLEARLEVARGALREAEAAFGCGAVARPDALATAWLIEGAIETFAGDKDAAAEAFVAASRVAPDRWLDALGARLKAERDAAVAAASLDAGSLDVVGAPPGAFLAVDGLVATSPARVASGLHLVQAGRSEADVVWGKIVYLPPGQRVAVEVPAFSLATGPAAPAPAPAVEPAAVEVPAEPPERSSGLFVHAAVGAGSAFGDALTLGEGADELTEPAVKLSVPLELGVSWRGPLWLRGAVGTAPLVGGQLLYATSDGVAGWPVSVFAHGALGGSAGPADLGVLAGMSLPGRIETRGVASVALGQAPLRLELRGGINVATSRSVEPAVGLLLAFDPHDL